MDRWHKAIDPQRIVSISADDEIRAVDIAMGIVANRWGNNSDFSKNIGARQDLETIDTVMESVRAASQYIPGSSESVMFGGSAALLKSSKLLIGGEK